MAHDFNGKSRSAMAARRSLQSMAAAVLCTGTLLACSNSHRTGPGAGEPEDEAVNVTGHKGQPLSYYRDAKPVIDQKCGICHYEGGLGPMPFSSYKEIKPFLPLIEADVEKGTMPPWRATGEHGVFEGDRRLTDEQKETLLSWIAQGAPEGDSDEEPESLARDERGLPRVDETLELEEEFTPAEDADTYRCFLFEWPHSERKFITGLSVEPERRDLVHHAIVYLVQPNAADAARQRDEADPGPGYDCLTSINLGSWLTSYEPGGYGQMFTGGVGMQIEPGSIVLLQVHYNTQQAGGADRSRLDLMLEDEVERPGRTTLILNALWVARFMPIPANNADVVHRWQGVPTALQGSAQDIFAVDLHMHTLGSSGSIGIIRAGSGRSETLLDIPDWAFEWQETYRFKEPVRLERGDQLFVECHFDNTAANQQTLNGKKLSPIDVNWGENTRDEMCLGNVLTTPAL